MANSNCLHRLKCPRCGNEDRLHIVATAQFEVTDDGAEPLGHIEWDDRSFAECPECSFVGILAAFNDSNLTPTQPSTHGETS
ncbi:MAG: hypothetical protein AB7I30_05640 [Isosphaeraceae bacterium]